MIRTYTLSFVRVASKITTTSIVASVSVASAHSLYSTLVTGGRRVKVGVRASLSGCFRASPSGPGSTGVGSVVGTFRIIFFQSF